MCSVLALCPTFRMLQHRFSTPLREEEWWPCGLSDFTFFVDIASAYYTLLIQLSVDLSCGDEDICCFLRRMGVENAHISEVARLFSETPAINDLDAPTHLRSMIAEFHSSTWFAIPCRQLSDGNVAWDAARRWVR